MRRRSVFGMDALLEVKRTAQQSERSALISGPSVEFAHYPFGAQNIYKSFRV